MGYLSVFFADATPSPQERVAFLESIIFQVVAEQVVSSSMTMEPYSPLPQVPQQVAERTEEQVEQVVEDSEQVVEEVDTGSPLDP
jgi:hypothetical protein